MWPAGVHPPFPNVLVSPGSQACGCATHITVYPLCGHSASYRWLSWKGNLIPQQWRMQSMEVQRDTMNTRANLLALFDEHHGSLYIPTGKRDQRLNIPSKGRASEFTLMPIPIRSHIQVMTSLEGA